MALKEIPEASVDENFMTAQAVRKISIGGCNALDNAMGHTYSLQVIEAKSGVGGFVRGYLADANGFLVQHDTPGLSEVESRIEVMIKSDHVKIYVDDPTVPDKN